MQRSGLTDMFIACGFISLTTTKTIIPMVMYGKKMRLRTARRYRLMAAQQEQ
jgi:hypothetical protein